MSAPVCDVAVVGGGLVGSALAYELVTRGLDVVLVDAHHPGRATDAGAGILSPETTWNPDPTWFSFGMAAAAHYRTLVGALGAMGTAATGFDECGLLLVATEPGEDEWFATRADLALGRCPDSVEAVPPEAARELFPPLGEVRGAVYNRAAGRVDGRRMTAAVLDGAERHGLRRLSAAATGLDTSRGRVVAVDTEEGPVACATVVIAGGAWSPTFGRALDVRIPVTPVKGQIVHMELPPDEGGIVVDSGSWPIVAPVFTHYLVAWPGGRVACGGTYEPDAGFDARPTVAGLHELLHACLTMAPGLSGASVVDVRVGLRPVSADDLPVLGPVPGWDNVQLVTGHGTEGLLLGPYSAALVARCVTEGVVPAELTPFSMARFVD